MIYTTSKMNSFGRSVNGVTAFEGTRRGQEAWYV